MTFERIPSPSHPLYAEAMALYGISFPAHEQRETPSQTAILTHPDYHFTAILDGSAFVGDMLYWKRRISATSSISAFSPPCAGSGTVRARCRCFPMTAR